MFSEHRINVKFMRHKRIVTVNVSILPYLHFRRSVLVLLIVSTIWTCEERSLLPLILLMSAYCFSRRSILSVVLVVQYRNSDPFDVKFPRISFIVSIDRTYNRFFVILGKSSPQELNLRHKTTS